MRFQVTVITILWALVSGSAVADTSATLKYLAAEPATLLDLGMLRLEAAMDDLAQHPGMRMQFASGSETPIITTSYDAEDQLIRIQANYEFSKPHSVDERTLRSHLKEKVQLLKMRLGVDPSNGEPLMSASALLAAFSHQNEKGNFEIAAELDPLLKRRALDLDQITEVAARVGIRTRCSSSLRKVEIECTGSR